MTSRDPGPTGRDQVKAELARLDDTNRIAELLAVIERRLAEPEPAPGSPVHLVPEVALLQLRAAKIRLTMGADAASRQSGGHLVGRSTRSRCTPPATTTVQERRLSTGWPLHDGDLLTSDLTRLRLDGAELAYRQRM
jgi:hypothetical protein